MPWCDPCSQFHSPTAIDDGKCPTCGETVDADAPHGHDEAAETKTVGQNAPWHFWIVVVALAAYLLWRLIVGIGWVIGRL